MIDLFFSYLEQHIDLSDRDKRLIQSLTKIRKFKPKEQLLKKGEISDSAYFILSGVVRYYNIDEEGQESTTVFADENKMVTKVNSFVKRVASDENIATVTSGELIELNIKDYLILCKEIQNFQRTLLIVFNRYLVEIHDFHLYLISMEAKDRYLAVMKKYPTILNRVPLSQVATFLGINQSTLSRIRKQAVTSWQ